MRKSARTQEFANAWIEALSSFGAPESLCTSLGIYDIFDKNDSLLREAGGRGLLTQEITEHSLATRSLFLQIGTERDRYIKENDEDALFAAKTLMPRMLSMLEQQRLALTEVLKETHEVTDEPLYITEDFINGVVEYAVSSLQKIATDAAAEGSAMMFSMDKLEREAFPQLIVDTLAKDGYTIDDDAVARLAREVRERVSMHTTHKADEAIRPE